MTMTTIHQELEQDNYLTKLIQSVAPNWRSEFQRFVETGEADEAFLTYLNKDASAQEAVEEAFNHQVSQFEGLAAELKKRRTPESQEAMPSLTSTKLAAVVEVVMQTPREQREEVVKTRTAEFAASVPIEDRNVLTQVARSLESNLSKLAEASHR
jgi:hypothetical protein